VSMSIGIVVLGNVITTAVIRRVGARNMLYLSFIILAGGVLAAAFGQSLMFVVVAQFTIGLSTGINYPILMGMSIERVDESQRATAMGVYQSVYAVGMFTGPWLSGLLADALGIQPMFTITGFFILALGIFGTYWLTQPIKSTASTTL
jgi:MFS transporter, DHA1 family, multidrug resistance protein